MFSGITAWSICFCEFVGRRVYWPEGILFAVKILVKNLRVIGLHPRYFDISALVLIMDY